MTRDTATVDPVLIRLQEWALARSLSREAIARRLDVSRPAVAGWFLALEAELAGKPRPSSARGFRFTKQRPEVQRAIADVLDLPVALLVAESSSVDTGIERERAAALPQGLGPLGAVVDESGTADVAASLLGDLASGGDMSGPGVDGAPRGGTLRHRAAEVVEGVDGVRAVMVVAEPRGSDRAEPYQHQVTVFVGEPGPSEAPETFRARIRYDIDLALARSGLPLYWEHGSKEPVATVVVEGRPLTRLGSLVCPLVSSARRPRRGLLVTPDGPAARHLRMATLVTSPYGGSDPIGGHTARALDCGHVRAADIVRAVRDAEARRQGGTSRERAALLSDDAERDAGFAVHQALHVLQTGRVPGAWLLSMEVATLDGEAALQEALVQAEGVLVIVRLGPEWRAHAAWRLAAADLNSAAQASESTVAASSDHLQIVAGAPLGAAAHAVLARQAAAAADWRLQLDEWEGILDDLERRRAALPGRATVGLVLDLLPDDGECMRVEDGRCEPVRGADRFTGVVVFTDSVDGLMDAWIEASADLVERLVELAGGRADRLGRKSLDSLRPGPVARLVTARAMEQRP
jgi:hypothetical protein